MPDDAPTYDPGPPRFLVDGMLLKLGRYLRCLGYDAAWDPEASTARRVRTANEEGRVLLTRNRRLEHVHPLPLRSVLVRSDDAVEQLAEVVEALGLDPRARLFTRCVRCNVELARLSDEEVRGRELPERVRAAYRRFYGCPRCGTTFWRGSHVRNTCRKLGLPDGSEC